MAKSILEITPTLSSTITFKKTNAEVGEVLSWFIADWAGPMPEELTTVAQQNQWRLEQAHRKMLDYVVREARQNREKMLHLAFGRGTIQCGRVDRRAERGCKFCGGCFGGGVMMPRRADGSRGLGGATVGAVTAVLGC